MELVIGRELELYGSHGLAASDYQPLLDLILSGRLPVAALVKKRISLAEAPAALVAMGNFGEPGITVIDRF